MVKKKIHNWLLANAIFSIQCGYWLTILLEIKLQSTILAKLSLCNSRRLLQAPGVDLDTLVSARLRHFLVFFFSLSFFSLLPCLSDAGRLRK